MVLVEYKSDAKHARWRPYSYESIESAIPYIRARLKSQKTVACRVKGRDVFGINGDQIVYMNEVGLKKRGK
jgi:hypothetical protein